MELKLYNTLTRKKERFVAIDDSHLRIYACGPTVYDKIHIGNARPLVVFDVLVAILRATYPKVTYVRNITDVDDKINARAGERGIPIQALCAETIETFHKDTQALLVGPPDIEPRATEHIAQMIAMISQLIEKDFAYAAEGHVLFSVKKMLEYGALSGRSLDEMIAGARVEVAPYKADAADFVLWKPSEKGLPSWDSPWGPGRPGWHIECSAMAAEYLGAEFDIHAGGLDLIFPHHENEIAQSRCAHNTAQMARYWLHNGYVTVNGEKMSKSLGNFTTVGEALTTHRGEAIRLGLLSTHYRAPFDFSAQLIQHTQLILDKLYRAASRVDRSQLLTKPEALDADFFAALGDDLNTPLAISRLQALANDANKGSDEAALQLASCADLLHLLRDENWFNISDGGILDAAQIEAEIDARNAARAARDFARADAIRDKLASMGIRLLDGPEGTSWEKS
jgi:cysteinyl-tRNA synthetase